MISVEPVGACCSRIHTSAPPFRSVRTAPQPVPVPPNRIAFLPCFSLWNNSAIKIRLPRIPTISSMGSSYGYMTTRPIISHTKTNMSPNKTISTSGTITRSLNRILWMNQTKTHVPKIAVAKTKRARLHRLEAGIISMRLDKINSFLFQVSQR